MGSHWEEHSGRGLEKAPYCLPGAWGSARPWDKRRGGELNVRFGMSSPKAMNRRPGEPGHRDRRRLSRKSVRTPLPPPQVWIRRSPQYEQQPPGGPTMYAYRWLPPRQGIWPPPQPLTCTYLAAPLLLPPIQAHSFRSRPRSLHAGE